MNSDSVIPSALAASMASRRWVSVIRTVVITDPSGSLLMPTFRPSRLGITFGTRYPPYGSYAAEFHSSSPGIHMDHTPLSSRLEELRAHLGIATLQEFVDVLNARVPEHFPYATARRYHKDREPTPSYLKAVGTAYGARLDWLIYGEGEPTRSSRLRRRAVGGQAAAAQEEWWRWEDVVEAARTRFLGESDRLRGDPSFTVLVSDAIERLRTVPISWRVAGEEEAAAEDEPEGADDQVYFELPEGTPQEWGPDHARALYVGEVLRAAFVPVQAWVDPTDRDLVTDQELIEYVTGVLLAVGRFGDWARRSGLFSSLARSWRAIGRAREQATGDVWLPKLSKGDVWLSKLTLPPRDEDD
jgi:hypothetical protein